MILKTENLTTPEQIDQNVASFFRTLSTEAPIYIDVRPEPWCKQSNCEMNVDKFIELHGGDKMLARLQPCKAPPMGKATTTRMNARHWRYLCYNANGRLMSG